MKKIGASEHHQKNELYANILFANYLDPVRTFFEVSKKDEFIVYLDTKKKTKILSQTSAVSPLGRIISVRSSTFTAGSTTSATERVSRTRQNGDAGHYAG